MAITATELLPSLVSIASVNTMGRALEGPIYGEARLTEQTRKAEQREQELRSQAARSLAELRSRHEQELAARANELAELRQQLESQREEARRRLDELRRSLAKDRATDDAERRAQRWDDA